jgi:hypothetical protein
VGSRTPSPVSPCGVRSNSPRGPRWQSCVEPNHGR